MKFYLARFCLLIAVVVTCSAGTVEARPVVGDIDFSGVVTFDTMSLATATQVINWNSAFVTRSAGDFAGIAFGTTPVMSAWAFNPSTPTPMLWSVGGFTFNLSQSTVVTQSSTFLNITGIGTITGNGFDPTPGVWSFTSSNSGGNNQATFSFQVNTAAVPESGTLALVGVGSLPLLFLLRRRKAAARS